MDDNLNLTQEVKQRYESIYTGVFYERYVLGLWVVAEGAIYPMFREKEHLVPCEERKYDQYYISCDYGTMNPFSAGLWGRYKGVWYRVKEYYHNGRASKNVRTDEQYYKDLETLAGNLPIRSVIVDPSAASFIACIRKHGRFNVTSAENDVLNGIRNVATCYRRKKSYLMIAARLQYPNLNLMYGTKNPEKTSRSRKMITLWMISDTLSIQ